MKCKKIQKRISALLDGAIAGEEKESLEAHIKGCPACQSKAEQLAHLSKLLTALPPVEIPPYLAERTLARLKGQREKAQRRSLIPAWVQWASAFTAILLGLMLGWGMGIRISENMLWRENGSTELTVWQEETAPVDPVNWLIDEINETGEVEKG